MKVIFLDIDGVLNLSEKRFNINKKLLSILKVVVEETNAKIVLSSTRRLYKEAKDFVKKCLLEKNIKIMSSTPKVGDSSKRFLEIEKWLKNHPKVKKYAIIDDREDAGYGMEKNFFQTNPKIGLTYELADKIIDYLT